MSINLSVPSTEYQLTPRITVIGVGGAGGNAVNNMIRSGLEGVDFLVANTDAQAIAQSIAPRRIQLGRNITHGLGAGARPDVGRAAAEEAMEDLIENLRDAHMIFVTAGMGGGTGTGAAPVIARIAREHGILTVGVVTKPFQFEGNHRLRLAEAGIEEMQQYVDTLIVIPNQNLFRIANEKTTFADAFAMADEVLYSGVRGVTDLMVVPGLINLDFADIRTVMSEMGKAMMGTGEAEGEDRARRAAEAAISNPLLDEVSMKGARGVLINITGGGDLTLFEVDEAANRIGEEVAPDANIIFGSTLDPSIDGKIRVSVVATGIDAVAQVQPKPVIRVVSQNPAKPYVVADKGRVAEPPLAAEPPQVVAEAAEETATVATGTGPMVHVGPIGQPAAPRVPTAERHASPAGGDVFIPPEPVNPKVAAEPARVDPFKAAEMMNPVNAPAAPAPRPPRRGTVGTIFQRMTGSLKSPAPAPAAPAAAEPEVARPSTVQRAAPAVPPPVPAAPPAPPQAAAPAPAAPAPRAAQPRPSAEQARLEGVDPQDRLPSSRSEEDLLDIPAFLRRQAN
ncbi:MAG: cell division protein FtsZ [Rhodospirillales bacterium]